MEAVYYGLPMYTFGDATKDAPLPPRSPPTSRRPTIGGLHGRSLTLQPRVRDALRPERSAAERSSTSRSPTSQAARVSGAARAPELVVRSCRRRPAGTAARGALHHLAHLADRHRAGTPAVTEPSVGVRRVGVRRARTSAFPSTFATHHVAADTRPARSTCWSSRRRAWRRRPRGQGITETVHRLRRRGRLRRRIVDRHDRARRSTPSRCPFRGRSTSTRRSSRRDRADIAAVVLLVQRRGRRPTECGTRASSTGAHERLRRLGRDGARPAPVPLDPAGRRRRRQRRDRHRARAPRHRRRTGPTLGDPGPSATITGRRPAACALVEVDGCHADDDLGIRHGERRPTARPVVVGARAGRDRCRRHDARDHRPAVRDRRRLVHRDPHGVPRRGLLERRPFAVDVPLPERARRRSTVTLQLRRRPASRRRRTLTARAGGTIRRATP